MVPEEAQPVGYRTDVTALRVFVSGLLAQMTQTIAHLEAIRHTLDLEDREDAATIEDYLDDAELHFCDLYKAIGLILGQIRPRPR